MSLPDHSLQTLRCESAPLAVQVAAWLAAVAACVLGMLDWVGEWSPTLATVQLIGLAIAPILYMLPSRNRSKNLSWWQVGDIDSGCEDAIPTRRPIDWLTSLILGGIAFTVSWRIGVQFGDLPPAYHDEFSYLFQAQTLLSGRFSFPSHPLHPELFDQMHVLNEGRMASRYYPGTGLWLAPFVAFKHPYLGQWIAGAVATMLIFWTGREIGGRQAGFFAGLVMALSPGIGLFGNTLLAHQPTLLSLSWFLFGVMRWIRTRAATDAAISGCGLGFAMLCRPMTAAAVGLPFGVAVVVWLLGDWHSESTGAGSRRQRMETLLGFGIPLLLGWGIMLSYNHDVTGAWLKSPYQLYTEVYTPRHVYGFNNVVRGEQQLGPKVLDAYDRWAVNLTPQVAVQNALIRWIASWQWTFDIVPLVIGGVVVFSMLPRLDRRWFLLVASLASLHLWHVPYWYVGIMGWHYVYESAPLWCLIVGGGTSLLFAEWDRRGHGSLRTWWRSMLVISVVGIYFSPGGLWPARLQRGLSALQYPRRQHAELRQWVEQHVDRRPALVLLEQQQTVSSHLDLMVNEPGLNAPLLLGRYRPGQTDLAQICRDFPDRQVSVACPERRTIRRID